MSEFDTADDIIEEIDDGIWVPMISHQSVRDTMHAVIEFRIWRQAGGIFTNFCGFYATKSAAFGKREGGSQAVPQKTRYQLAT